MTLSPRRQFKGHCPNCGPAVNADVVAEYVIDGKNPRWQTTSEIALRILQCPSCEAAYCQREYLGAEPELDPTTGQLALPTKFSYWPVPARRRRPDWMDGRTLRDPTLEGLILEVYAALDADLRVLAAIGIRTAFDRASELLQVEPSLSFARKLDALTTTAMIAPAERRLLEALIDAGGAAAHRSWRPDAGQLGTMMDIIEAFIKRSFILPERSLELRQAVPPRGKPKA